MTVPQWAVRSVPAASGANREADKVKNAFDLNSLVTRRMDKLNPNETYTVYKVDVPDEAITGEDEDILNYDDLDDPDAFV